MIICYLRYDIYSLYELYSTNDSYVKREGDDFLPTKKCQDRGAQYTAETPTTQTTVQNYRTERQKTIVLISKTLTMHEHYILWYISLPSSAKQQHEMTIFKVLRTT